MIIIEIYNRSSLMYLHSDLKMYVYRKLNICYECHLLCPMHLYLSNNGMWINISQAGVV